MLKTVKAAVLRIIDISVMEIFASAILDIMKMVIRYVQHVIIHVKLARMEILSLVHLAIRQILEVMLV